jgi:hypothetical protein
MPLHALALAALLLTPLIAKADEQALVEVYKSPTCGCCVGWIEHLEANGFRVKARNVEDMTSVKRAMGIAPALSSCHTAQVEGYIIEGHVPAQDIVRLLRERPALVGLAVPRMPIGSPGMEGPNPETYRVLGFDARGDVTIFAVHVPASGQTGPADAQP